MRFYLDLLFHYSSFRLFCLLPRHHHAQRRFVISYQITADIHGHAVHLPGEWKGRLVLWRYRGTRVRAAIDGTEQTNCQRIGQRNVTLSDQLAVDIELASARRTFSVGKVRLAGYFELELQLVVPLGDRTLRLDIIQVLADVVVGVAELAALNIERIAAIVVP